MFKVDYDYGFLKFIVAIQKVIQQVHILQRKMRLLDGYWFWLLLLLRAGCQEEMLGVGVGLPPKGHEVWILLASHTEVWILLARHQNVDDLSFDLWSYVSHHPVLGQMSWSQKLRPVAVAFVKLENNCFSTEFGCLASPFNLLHDKTGSGNLRSPGQGVPNMLVMLCLLLTAIARQSFPAIGRFFF